ncbi:MAG: YfhO family protein [Acidobacteria bacterium]|nr:YfhO family protein [Acidobacteriota bacterium]
MRRAVRALPISFFFLLSLALTAPVLLSDGAFYFRDLLSHHIPHLELGARLWMSDGLPLWSSLFSCGEPHLANPQNLALHPIQFLYLMMPPHSAFAASLFLLFLLCGGGMYACARGLGASVASAMVAGAAFELSGFILSLGNLANLLAAAAPLPLLFLFAARVVMSIDPKPGFRGLVPRRAVCDLALAAMMFGLQILGGEPFIAALSFASLASLLPFVAAGTWRRRVAVTLSALVLIGTLGTLLNAATLVPAAAFLPETVRAWGFRPQWALQWSLHPSHLTEVLVPGVFGHPASSDSKTFWGSEWFDRGRPFILALGIGKVALLAAGAALWSNQERSDEPASPAGLNRAMLVRALGWSALGFTVLAFGRHVLFRLELLSSLQSIPLLRYPVRFFLIPTFAICLLSAFGVDSWLAGTRRSIWGRVALVGSGALALAAGVSGALGSGGSLTLEAGLGIAHALARSAFALGLVGAVLLFGTRLRQSHRFLGTALVILAIAEPLLSYGRLNPTAPSALLNRTPAAADWLRSEPGRFRIWRDNSPPLTQLASLPEPDLARTLWFRDTLHPSYGMPYGLSYALNRTGDETDTKRTATLAHRLAKEPPAVRARVFGLAGIRYLLAFEPAQGEELQNAAHFELPGPDLWLWRNRMWLPTARWVKEARFVSGGETALDLLLSQDHDPTTVVILETEQETSDAPDASRRKPFLPGRSPDLVAGQVEILEETSRYLKIRTLANEAGYLVLADQFSPGWEARVDGSEVPVLRADFLFRGVRVPAGRHQVEFNYRPLPVRIGLVLSLAALVTLAGLFGLGRLRAENPTSSPPLVL